MAASTTRVRGPNILVTGTPGVGKSTLCSEVSQRSGLEWINVGEVAKEGQFYDGYDEELECHNLDEDRLLDELEERLKNGGVILEYHACELFPERWFDAVFVLRTDNKMLYDRLIQRGYSAKKMEMNMECEIMQSILDEAKESYAHEIVHELSSNTPDDMESNAERIAMWVELWKHDNGVE